MKKCKQCGYALTSFSQKFYCCDKQQLVCSFCRRDSCKKCKKPRTIQMKMPQCAKCYSRLSQNEVFLDPNCGKCYCSRCLVSIFKSEYRKGINSNQLDNKSLIKLFCGHHSNFKDLFQFFDRYCVECGKQYRQAVDYELKDGAKLCHFCFNYFKKQYIHAFLLCVSCGRQIQNYLKLGVADANGLILCRQCVDQSQIEEVYIEKTKELNQSKNVYQSVHFVQQQKMNKQQERKSSENYSFNKSSQEYQKKIEQKVPEQKVDFVYTKIIDDDWIKTQKKQEPFPQPLKSINQKLHVSPYIVTNTLENQMQEGDEELRLSLGLKDKLMLRKHLQDETFVENLQLKILPNNVQDFIYCKDCNTQVAKKIAYDLLRSASSKNKSSSFISISSLEASFISQISEETRYICRVCYSKCTQRQKSLSTKKLPATQTSLTQSRSKASQLQKPLDRSRVESSAKSQYRYPSPSPYKGYGLTGVGTSIFEADPKKQPHTEQQRVPQRGKTPIRTQPQNIKLNASQYSSGLSSSQRDAKRCKICGQDKKKLILSFSQGYYCQECYYMIRPSPYSKVSRYIY